MKNGYTITFMNPNQHKPKTSLKKEETKEELGEEGVPSGHMTIPEKKTNESVSNTKEIEQKSDEITTYFKKVFLQIYSDIKCKIESNDNLLVKAAKELNKLRSEKTDQFLLTEKSDKINQWKTKCHIYLLRHVVMQCMHSDTKREVPKQILRKKPVNIDKTTVLEQRWNKLSLIPVPF